MRCPPMICLLTKLPSEHVTTHTHTLTDNRHTPAGDSFLTGYANTGGTDNCNYGACTAYGCLPSLDTQDATLAWDP